MQHCVDVYVLGMLLNGSSFSLCYNHKVPPVQALYTPYNHIPIYSATS